MIISALKGKNHTFLILNYVINTPQRSVEIRKKSPPFCVAQNWRNDLGIYSMMTRHHVICSVNRYMTAFLSVYCFSNNFCIISSGDSQYQSYNRVYIANYTMMSHHAVNYKINSPVQGNTEGWRLFSYFDTTPPRCINDIVQY